MPLSQNRESRNRLQAFALMAIYAVFGGLWIVFSDRILALFYTTPEDLTAVQTYKGWFYVAITAMVGYFMVLRALRHRSAAEDTVRDSERRLKTILETAQDGVWEKSNDGSSYYSESLFRMLGYPRAEHAEAEAFLKSIIHPDDLAAFESVIAVPLQADAQPREIEARFRTEGGAWRNVLVRVKCAERTDAGRVVRVVGVHTDITARRETDEALRRANLIVQNSPAVLFRWRAEDVWPVEYVSENISQWGYAAEEFLSARVQYADIVHPDDYPAVLRLAHEYERSGLTNFQMEYRIHTKSSETRWVNEHSLIERDAGGNPTHYQGFVLDVTGRKEAELALRESQQRYKSLFEAANDAIYLMDGLTVVACNARACAMYGVKREEIVGSTPAKFSTAAQPDGESSEELAGRYVAEALAGRPQFFTWRHQRANGEDLMTEVSLNRVKLGERYFLQAIERDITERLHAEEEKARLETQLHQAQKMEAIGQLAGGVAHDFNNLLQVIHGYTDLAREEIPGDSPALECLAEVGRAADRATSLVSQLLAFSRRTPLKPEPVSPVTLVQELSKMLERLIGETIDLRVRCTEDVPELEADVAQLQQVVINLCLNARDAMPEGGEITIEVDRQTLDDEFCRHTPWARAGDFVRVAVSDTGVGMPEEIRDHIFEPFFTTKEVGKGTGLGLATVYANIQRHRGLLNFFTEEGKGTRFEVFLPVHQDGRQQSAHPEEPPAVLPQGTGTILLAEDDELVRRLSMKVLTHAGYRVYAARNGEEALALFNEHENEIDLLVFDVIMPRKHGPAVYDAIVQSGKTLPAIFTSGYSEGLLHWNGATPPNVYLLEKPYPSSQLIRKVAEALHGATLTQGPA